MPVVLFFLGSTKKKHTDSLHKDPVAAEWIVTRRSRMQKDGAQHGQTIHGFTSHLYIYYHLFCGSLAIGNPPINITFIAGRIIELNDGFCS